MVGKLLGALVGGLVAGVIYDKVSPPQVAAPTGNTTVDVLNQQMVASGQARQNDATRMMVVIAGGLAGSYAVPK